MKSFRFSPGRAAFLAGVIGVSLSASAQAGTIIGGTLLNGDFNNTDNNGTIGVGLLSSHNQGLGNGPWRSYGNGIDLGLVHLLAPGTSISSGTASVNGLVDAGVLGPLLNNSGGFYQLTSTNWEANTTYTLTAEVDTSTSLIDLELLSDSGVGIALYSSTNDASLGSIVTSSISTSPNPAILSVALFGGDNSSGRITLTFTTGASAVPTGQIGVRLFAGEDPGVVAADVLGTVVFDNVTLDSTPVAVPEPSGVVLGLGALGFLALNRRRKN